MKSPSKEKATAGNRKNPTGQEGATRKNSGSNRSGGIADPVRVENRSGKKTDRPGLFESGSHGNRVQKTTGTKTTGARKQGKTTDPPQSGPSPRPEPQPVYRPSDNRPQQDDAALEKLGIYRYESKRLRLYTDLKPAEAKKLPPLLDQAYEAWVRYFGELPPTREGTPFQVTGYLMVDQDRFRRAGLIPADLPKFLNGRHRGYEFWMYEPPWPYYRRHLLIHEATHCFMYAVRDVQFPVWYMEGMAEFFGTHVVEDEGRARFGVIPDAPQRFVGSGRIEYVQRECRNGRVLSLKNVAELKAEDFVHNEAYAWSWALCLFFDSHPRYQQRFRELGRITTSGAFRRKMAELVHSESPQIYSEWHLFAVGLDYGYDPQREAIDIAPGQELPPGNKAVRVDIRADRGWQSSGVWVRGGDWVEISAEGRFLLGNKPKPWLCEPQGITFTYYQGRPLGELQAVIVPDSKKSLPLRSRILPRGPVGRQKRIRAGIKGTIYLRVNDAPGWLADNSGSITVTIRRSDAPLPPSRLPKRLP